jgi:hypothetical protein
LGHIFVDADVGTTLVGCAMTDRSAGWLPRIATIDVSDTAGCGTGKRKLAWHVGHIAFLPLSFSSNLNL